jgi:hypothetical protein
MANIIRPKRSNTAAKVPNTTELTSGELGVNMADRKVYINNGTTVVQVGAGNLSGLGDVAVTSPSNGQSLAYNSTTSKWENSAGGSGTVTSVGITPGTGVTVSGSPITTSGNIAVGLSTKLTAIENLSGAGFFTQNGSGQIAGRTLQAGTGISIAHGNGSSQDPTITNSAPDQTVVLTGAGATSITGTYPSFTISSVNTTYSPATSTVAGLIELGSDTAQTVAANAVSATASRSYALQVNAAGQGVVNVPWTDTNSGGTVTSVGGTGTVSGLTLTGTVTTSGNLTLGGTLAVTPSDFASQTANTILAAPNGTAGVPTFRALVAADVPTLNQSTTGNAATATTLQTARTIGGVSFNGSANINLPGVNTAGNQNTSGTAAVSTAATVTTSATASAFKVPFANTTASTTGNYGLLQDSEATFTYNPSTNTLVVGTVSAALSGNATTATTLQTARTIGGVSFNGSANINLPGVNTAGNQNTTGTAANVTGTVAVAKGGTGQTTYTNGQLLIGNTTGGTLAKATLTAGTGITVTNGAGAITIAATNNGTVTSVGTTGTVAGITLTGTVTTSGNLTLGGTFALPNGQVTGKMIYNSFTATAAQTTFTTTNTYTSGKIEVFVNGVKLVNGSDVTVTSGTSVVMASGLPVNTRVDLVYPI